MPDCWKLLAATAAFMAALPGSVVHAQLSNDTAPVVVGHYRLNVSSVAEHRRFWIDVLGGAERRLDGVSGAAIEFPDVVLLLHEASPDGPTLGTTFDHIGFAVPDVPAMTSKVVAAGYELTVGREPAPGETASPPTAGNYGRFSYLIGPDGVKVELVTNEAADAPPIAHHHVHFVNRQFVAMQQWYMRVFDASLRPGQTDFFIGADLPGVGYMLNFFSWLPETELTGTDGRAVERVGFDVRDLDMFLTDLERKNIPVISGSDEFADLPGVRRVTIADPWGTLIDVTEGMRGLVGQ